MSIQPREGLHGRVPRLKYIMKHYQYAAVPEVVPAQKNIKLFCPCASSGSMLQDSPRGCVASDCVETARNWSSCYAAHWFLFGFAGSAYFWIFSSQR